MVNTDGSITENTRVAGNLVRVLLALGVGILFVAGLAWGLRGYAADLKDVTQAAADAKVANDHQDVILDKLATTQSELAETQKLQAKDIQTLTAQALRAQADQERQSDRQERQYAQILEEIRRR